MKTFEILEEMDKQKGSRAFWIPEDRAKKGDKKKKNGKGKKGDKKKKAK